jgi:cytochrome c-type biogenesis protein CcmH/NrfG
MGQRRALVIGSQCDVLPKLAFLPARAQDLYAVLTDPGIGQCLSALGDQSGLMIDKTVGEVYTAIETAFQRASDQSDTLVVALIGHGWGQQKKFYFLAKNSPDPPTFREAIRVAEHLADLLGRHSSIDGLILLIDTCCAGVAAFATAATLGEELPHLARYEIVTATGSMNAYDGCFTQALVETLRQGLDEEAGDTLLCLHLTQVADQACGDKQVSDHISRKPDKGLFVGKNVARAPKERPWERTSQWARIEDLTRWFQPTGVLEPIVEATRRQRCVAVVGQAGTGKSATAAALARSDVTAGHVPEGFVQAIALINQSTDSMSMAEQLSSQLAKSTPDFAKALSDFEESVPRIEWQMMDIMHRLLLGPLRRVGGRHAIRIVFDALDQIPESATQSIYRALDQMVHEADFEHVHLIVTSRPDTPLPIDAKILDLGRAKNDDIDGYLARRGLPAETCAAVTQLADGSWVVANVFANLVTGGGALAEELPGELSALYDRVLMGLGATPNNNRWRKELRPILAILSVSGPDASLPIELLCTASGHLGGTSRISHVRDVLVDLRGFVNRISPGTPQEHDGLFHATFAQKLLNPAEGQFIVDGPEARDALVQAIGERAPRDERHDPTDPAHRYAAVMEPQLLWELGRREDAEASLDAHESPIPAENLARWQSWQKFVKGYLTEDDPDILTTRFQVAYWTGQAGDTQSALALCKKLLPDCERVLGKDHPGTLTTRSNIASWAGETGDAQSALAFFKKLLPNRKRVLGKDHPDTLTTRGNIASWSGETGDAKAALALFEKLLPDQERVLGKDHPDTLTTRSNIAFWAGETGDAQSALALFKKLLPDRERVLGKDHPDTLTTRSNIASWIGETGDAQAALALFEKLLPDQERVLGKDHPDTLTTRGNIASWTGRTGDAQSALALFKKLLPDKERVLGKDHPDTLTTRSNIASWIGETGDAQAALALFEKLLPDQERVLGKDHPGTLTTRSNIASWAGETGDAQSALTLVKKLLPDQERVLGKDHQDTLTTRRRIAFWTGRTGDAHSALALFEKLLPDQERVLGKDHQDTLTTRSNIAALTGKTGNAQAALALLKKLLPNRERVLGKDHPHTLTTRSNIAFWTREAGDAHSALTLVKKLLPDQERVLGKDHPHTLTTRRRIASWIGETGDAQSALALFKKLLPDQERVLGKDHPDTLTTRSNIASWAGETGDAQSALALFKKLLPDQEGVLGKDHPHTLTTRSNIAAWTREAGDAHSALTLLKKLLPDEERVLGKDHPHTLTTRSNIAAWTGETGDAQSALALFKKLLPDRERVLGKDHRNTLTTRNNIAALTGKTGDARAALALFKKLRLDQERVLGKDDPATLTTREWIAHFTKHSG